MTAARTAGMKGAHLPSHTGAYLEKHPDNGRAQGAPLETEGRGDRFVSCLMNGNTLNQNTATVRARMSTAASTAITFHLEPAAVGGKRRAADGGASNQKRWAPLDALTSLRGARRGGDCS